MKANVIGAGLAGCEAAWQLAERNVNVTLFEMKPNKKTPAHSSADFAELCCSNSLRADSLTNGVGLLKEEMRRLNSLIISCADETKVPAGGALAVDRKGFSSLITKKIKNHPNITVVCEEVTSLDFSSPTIVATGPLTSDALCKSIGEFVGRDYMYFYDAAAPIVTLESIDMSRAYRAARYGKGGDDYINCPMTEEEYNVFYDNLITAEVAKLHSFEDEKVFEGCMPIETMAKRGKQTMLFGPLKPVGLPDPKTGREPFAVVQLRQDNKDGTLYNIVGFQTHLKFGEQKRVFSMIGGLENANFVRYGVMHKNTYINSPGFLDDTFKCKKKDNLYFAGQMTGVEGYVESASSGLVAGVNLARRLNGKNPVHFTNRTAIGALACYISDESITSFAPMNVNFGIIESADVRIKNKAERYTYISNRALEFLSTLDVL